MEFKIGKIDWMFLFLCLLVGIVAEVAFFEGEIGVSYLVFIIVFYSLFFWRFRRFSFSHQRLGYLVLISIWCLAAGYYLYDTTLFSVLNLLVIPTLVIFHLALITSPKKMDWRTLSFILYILQRLGNGFRYSALFTNHVGKIFKRSSNEKHYAIWKKIIIGIAISVPFLFIILNLLISADTQFERLLSSLPDLFNIKAQNVFRIVVILLYTFGFFGFMQVLLQKNIQMMKQGDQKKPIVIDGIITLTVLLLLDLVYVIFVVVQFKYFFSGTLGEGFTYAEYARRGFFELLFVTLINLSVTIGVIYFTRLVQGFLKKTIRLALTVLVLSSGVLLVSAFMRMMMYEDAYGYTFTRVIAHSFMIFLMVIFAYTLVKIWLEKLSLFHFYFIASLIYYTGVNLINLDQFVVNQNMARYEETGKIDINYLNSLSSTGILALIDLYEKDPTIPGLEAMLKERKENKEFLRSDIWQSHNLVRDKAYKKLGEF
ncbi:DUF4153 domain-containing protein [Ferdinandcohnia quinoae]|uniref:DUF4173 domain-containing protein n=1 Tax=Fredinandcohnia quinoae TaxID=2918902 RepID=A0AAW5E4N0_9BACI|nr:DUF4173 domain-containing protein [Fredinandcohnia sp. SECRCQ15]MCH1627886.1 DUF4173 domain-containing protein [Fredinandcohnia sp. SECRCQ15]